MRITVAVPGLEDQDPPWPKLKNMRFIRFSGVGKWRGESYEGASSSSLHRIHSFHAHVDDLLNFHDPMLEGILQFYEESAKPRMVVTDRFSFAGYGAAQRFGSFLVVHNPTLLFDLDVSGVAVPCPFSDLHMLPSDDVFGRFLNFGYKFVNRLIATRVVAKLNKKRKAFDLPKVKRRGDLYGDAIILSDAAPWWMDYPRHMTPAIKFIGSVLPAETDIDLSNTHNESRLLVHGAFTETAKAVLEAVAKDLGYVAAFVGDSCLGPAGLASHLAQEKECVPQDLCKPRPVILAARVACVNAAASYGSGRPILAWSNSTEEHEVGNKLSDFGLGIHMENLTEVLSSENHSLVVALLRELEENSSYQSLVTKFGRALKRAGGVIQASNLLKLVFAYGSEPFVPPHRHMAWYVRYQLDTCSVVVLSFLAFLLIFQVFRTAVMFLLTEFLERCNNYLEGEDDAGMSNSITIKAKVN